MIDISIIDYKEIQNRGILNAVEPTIDKVVKKRKTKTTKAESFKNLESRKVIYDLHESDKTCHECDVPLVEVGSKTRETIEVIKKAVKVMEQSITYKRLINVLSVILFIKKLCQTYQYLEVSPLLAY